MKRKFYVSYVHDSRDGEKLFNHEIVVLDVSENDEKKIPVLLQEEISNKIYGKSIGRFFPVTLINFWEID